MLLTVSFQPDTLKARVAGCCALGLVLTASVPAGAVIKRVYPLSAVIADADTILVATVTSRDTKNYQVSLAPARSLKGNPAAKKLVVKLSGSDNQKQVPILLQRLVPGRQILLFGKTKKFMLGYTNGTWFRLAETAGGKPWQFVHLEVYLPRTFSGSTKSLEESVVGVLAGRSTAPPPDPSVTPGYGAP